MKKTYIQPQIKTRKLQFHTILAGSTVGMGDDESGSSSEPIEAGAKGSMDLIPSIQ